jgi:hypothetical protein
MTTTTQVNGTAVAGESLGSGLDFYTISTGVNILGGAFGTTSQNVLDRLVQIIAMNGQPVLLGQPTSDGQATPTYTLKFAIEHRGSWASAADLQAAILANCPASMGFTSSNLTVLVNPSL